jgi:hypothetical protein
VRALAPSAILLTLLAAAPVQAQASPDGRWLSWDAVKDGAAAYRLGDVKVRLRQETDGLPYPVAVVEARGVTTTLRGEAGSARGASAQFGLFRLHGASHEPVLLFRSYTGGAHCCFAYLAAWLTSGHWQVSDLEQWDGSALPEPKDVDGDGRLELVARDQRFLYQFDSYAGSLPPARIYELRDGKLADVSAAPRFRAYYAAQLPKYRAACEKGGAGACTGYVAVAARAGDAAPAFAVLEQSTAAAEGPFKVPGRCQDKSPAACPDETFDRLGDAVDRFLHDLGYLPEAAAPAGVAS